MKNALMISLFMALTLFMLLYVGHDRHSTNDIPGNFRNRLYLYSSTNGVSFAGGEKNKTSLLAKPTISCSTRLPECKNFFQSRKTSVAPINKSCCNCCTNWIVANHKMGFTLAKQLIRERFKSGVSFGQITKDNWENIGDQGHVNYWFTQPTGSPIYDDFRDVVIVRNLREAIVSGYLYHKDGRECWKDWFGNPKKNTQPCTAEVCWTHWPEYLAHVTSEIPQSNGRTLCQYLVDESEEHGLRAYADFALQYWHLPFRNYIETVISKGKTKRVCFERLNALESQEATLQEMRDWFTSGERHYKLSRISWVPENNHTMALLQDSKQKHSSNVPNEERKRLVEILNHVDETVFGGQIANATAIFDC